MKQFSLRLLIAVCSLFVGLAATIWLTKSPPDLTIYPVNVCDLFENPSKFDGKFVRVTALHGGLGIDTPTFLEDSVCHKTIREKCKMDGNSCGQMYSELREIGRLENVRARAQIEVVGRFTANVKDPMENGGLFAKRVDLLEITEVIKIGSVLSDLNLN